MPVLEFGLFEQAEKSSPVHLLFRTPLRERAVQAVHCGVVDRRRRRRHAVGGQTIEKYERASNEAQLLCKLALARQCAFRGKWRVALLSLKCSLIR